MSSLDQVSQKSGSLDLEKSQIKINPNTTNQKVTLAVANGILLIFGFIFILFTSVCNDHINQLELADKCLVMDHEIRLGPCGTKAGYNSFVQWMDPSNKTMVWSYFNCDNNRELLTDQLNFYYPVNSLATCYIDTIDTFNIYTHQSSHIFFRVLSIIPLIFLLGAIYAVNRQR